MTNNSPPFHLRLFGGPVLTWWGQEVSLSPLQTAFLALVYGHESEQVTRSRTAWLLWEADDEPRARHRISQLLYGMTKRLAGASPLDVGGDKIQGLKRDQLFLDLRTNPEAGGREVRRQVGGFMVDGFLNAITRYPTPSFEEWVHSRRLTIRRHLRQRSAQCYSDAMAVRNWVSASEAAHALLLLDPEDEECLRAVLRTAYLSDSPEEGEAAFRSFREAATHRVFDWEPSPATRELLSTLRHQSSISPRSDSRLRASIIGRKPQLSSVAALAQSTRAREPKAVVIEGEAGTGKTRFLHEVKKILRLQHFAVLSGDCAEFESTIPLNPILDALTCEAVHTRARSLKDPWRSVLAGIIPNNDESHGPLKHLPYVSPAAVPRRTFDALRILLEAIAAHGPLALILDDFHWTDASSAAALQFILRRWEGGRLLLVLALRPEGVKPASLAQRFVLSVSNATWIPLGPLDQGSAQDLIRAILGRRYEEGLADQILRLSGGNPLYLTELGHDVSAGVSTLRVGDSGRIFSESLNEMISRRLSGLSEQARSVLDVIAVARSLTMDALCSITSLPEALLLSALKELTHCRLLSSNRDRLVFNHEVIRHYVYTHSPLQVRQLWHRRLADRLTAEGAGAGELVFHWSAVGDQGKTYDFASAAAHQSESAGALPEAIYFSKLAMTHAPGGKSRTEMLRRSAHLQYANGEFAAAAESYDEVRRDLRDHGDIPGALLCDLQRADALGEVGLESQEVCLSILAGVTEEAEHKLANWELYHLSVEMRLKFLERLGRTSEIAPLLRKASTHVNRGSDRAMCLAFCTQSLRHLFLKGDGLESVQNAEQAFILAGDEGDLIARTFARRFLVLVNMGMLRLPPYVQLIGENLSFSKSTGDFKQRYNAHANTAVFLLDAGEYAAAYAHLERAKRTIRGESAGTEWRNLLCNLGDFYLSTGNFEVARDTFEQLRSQFDSPACKERVKRFGMAGLGLAAFSCGDLQAARACEEELGDIVNDIYYDAYPLFSFKAQMLRSRDRSDDAIDLLGNYASAIRGRLQLSWLKAKFMQAKFMARQNDSGFQEAAEEAYELATGLNLSIRAAQFAALMKRI